MYAEGNFAQASLTQRNKAIEAYLRHTMPTQSEQNISVNKPTAPAIYLPEKRPDPAKAVPKLEEKQTIEHESVRH